MKNNRTKKIKHKAKSGAKDIFDLWLEKSRIKEEDNWKVILKKISIKILGIFLLLLFSPILLIIFIMVVAVSL